MRARQTCGHRAEERAAAAGQQTGADRVQSLPESWGEAGAGGLPCLVPAAGHHPPLPPSEEVAHRVLAGLNPIAQQQTPILDLGTPCFLSFK